MPRILSYFLNNFQHSDLKPANFLLVSGFLKLIDFGIAKAIANDTTNIMRDYQTGTVNYMSPECINYFEQNGAKREYFKQGRASDVWALGCILYRVVYGYPVYNN
jgi:serine/threonine-protein kinase TTK/MPS1